MLYVLYCTTVFYDFDTHTEDLVLGIFDSMKLAEKAKKEFDENFHGDCPNCDEWDSHIEAYELNAFYDLFGGLFEDDLDFHRLKEEK